MANLEDFIVMTVKKSAMLPGGKALDARKTSAAITVTVKALMEEILQWCQKCLQSYPGIEVDNFNASWEDGRALCALIHKHCPSSVKFDELQVEPDDRDKNFNTAEKLARQHLDIHVNWVDLKKTEGSNGCKVDPMLVFDVVNQLYFKYRRRPAYYGSF